jgi:ABC-type nickel/cobalt efflux system permease component RcnA
METFYADAGLWTLLAASFILAATHSVSPDHWFPFVIVGRAQQFKTSGILALACLAGIGHVSTSMIIGLIGVFAKTGTSKNIATFLENATPLLLMIFGLGYAGYAIHWRMKKKHVHSHGLPIIKKWFGINPHSFDLPQHEHHHDEAAQDREHLHEHTRGDVVHSYHHWDQVNGFHSHNHDDEGLNEEAAGIRYKKAAWGLVAILGLTPCIALLPLTFAAVKYGMIGIILVNALFAASTIGTILLLTWLGFVGISWIRLGFFDQYGDIIAGMIIGLFGVLTKLFEL